jgi:hypothetical protein
VSEADQLAVLAELHQLFERERIEYWLFGGWAVDFHVGARTRAHEDLDVAIWLDDHARIAELLTAEGWAHAPERGQDGSTVYERDGVRLELAFLARDTDGSVYTPLRGGRADWAAGAFVDEVAELDGVRARVIGRRALAAEKSQPQADPAAAAKDRADLATLAAAQRAPRS